MPQSILENHAQNQQEESTIILSRRRFITHLAWGALLSAGCSSAFARTATTGKGSAPVNRSLILHNQNTGEKLKLTYFEKGRYIKPALREINHMLRDYRTGDVHAIDVSLLDQVHDLKLLVGANNRPVHIISGYRSPFTNNRLHYETCGVANNSLHMQGKAMDIRIEGVDCRHVRNAALAMRRGGVGYYHESNFVHIDTGKVRSW